MSSLLRLLGVLLLTASWVQAPASSAAAPSKDPMPMAQIEQLVAPIALYPDALLTQILMASTYPLDLVQADRWQQEHEDLKGEALDEAVRNEPWDESVKVLVQFPSLLGFMSDNLDWTQDLGDAVLGQMQDLIDAIQKLRREADLAGNLESNDKQRVEKAGDTIVIQPASAETVYVPTYDPAKVYGQAAPPTTNYYPAVYTDAAYGYAAAQPATTTVVTAPDTSYNAGLIGFGAGALVGGLLTAAIMWDDHDDHIYWGGPGRWGGASYWSQPTYWNNNNWRSPNTININRDIDRNRVNTGDININKVNKGISGNEFNRWNHNPERRGGVRYRDQATQARFAEQRMRGGIDRDEARGLVSAGDRPLKAPDVDRVRAQGASGGKVIDFKERQGGGVGRPDTSKDRPAAGEVRPKAPVKDKAAAKARPKADPGSAVRRPLDQGAKRPPPAGGKVDRPTRPEGALAKPQGLESRAGAAGAGAFKGGRPQLDRAASNRGAASRSSAGHANLGGRGAGGGGRAGGRGGRGH